MRRLIIGAALLLVVACNRKAKTSVIDQPGSCLPVPPALRYHIELDPSGESLYWLEAVTQYDYLSSLRSFTNLVRYDLRERHGDTLVDHAMHPMFPMKGVIVLRRQFGEKKELISVDRTKKIQVLTPDYIDVLEVGQIDDHRLILLAEGDGNRALFVYDIDHPRPRYLADADTFVSVDAKNVYVLTNNQAYAVDIETGAQTAAHYPEGGVGNGTYAYTVKDQVVHAQNMLTGEDKVISTEKNDWKLVGLRDSVLVRTAPKDDRSAGFLIEHSSETTHLPTVSGGTSLLAVAHDAKSVWSLVGHNTANTIGDLGDTVAETDVCLLPSGGPVIFQSRIVPGRYRPRQDKLMSALMRTAPGAGVQIAQDFGYPVAVAVTLKTEMGGSDYAKMRARVKEIHEEATKLLDDHDVRTEVTFADQRTAIRSWRRDRLSEASSVGMGDILLGNPEDVEAKVENLVNVLSDQRDSLTCEGTLTNMLDTKLENVNIRCANIRSYAIKVPVIEAHASMKFSKQFPIGLDDVMPSPFFEVTHNGEAVNTLDLVQEARNEELLHMAEDEYTASKLALSTHSTDREIKLSFWSPAEYFSYDEATFRRMARDAYRRFTPMKAMFGLYPDSPMSLSITVREHGITYDYDGVKLTKR